MSRQSATTSHPSYASSQLSALRAEQSSHPLSILTLAAPITAAASQTGRSPPAAASLTNLNNISPSHRTSDASSSELNENPTPASLAADLSHYKDLFSKLRFSYLEQVTKEKFLRSIVGDPPLLVSHADNVALETELAQTKAELKGRKEEVATLVEEMEGMARALATRWEGVQTRMELLEELPREIEKLEEVVERLRADEATDKEEQGGDLQQSCGSQSDPRMKLSLEETAQLVESQRDRAKQLEREIAALQRRVPSKVREYETAERELDALKGKRNDVAGQATEAQRIKEEGGRDELEERGKWYRSAETVLRGVIGVDD